MNSLPVRISASHLWYKKKATKCEDGLFSLCVKKQLCRNCVSVVANCLVSPCFCHVN
jgi:hypothetical protein